MKGQKSFKIPRAVFLLGVVSLCTDMASEMLYPIMPFYLDSIGFTVLGLGFLEGMASAAAGLSKGYFGRWSDLSSKRLPFVQIGYGLSAISKPLLAAWTNGYWVLTSRLLDRLGKGIRTGARDALLSDHATQETKARIFGFHKSMDTLGATIGPLLAILLLWLFPGSYKLLFLIAFIPGLLAIGATLLLPEETSKVNGHSEKMSFGSVIHYIKNSPPNYKSLISRLLLFSLFNSTDLFLLLYLSQIGLSDQLVIWIYVLYNSVFAILAYPFGQLADRYGLKTIFTFGLFLFVIAYGGLGLTHEFSWIILFLFVLYGTYAAATEGVAKAWISNSVNGKDVGSAVGSYESFNSIAGLLSSSLGGLIWYNFGATCFFITTAVCSLLLALSFIIYNPVSE